MHEVHGFHVLPQTSHALTLCPDVCAPQARVVGGDQILRGVSLTLREGETHAIMGTNGSGKSTLSKVLVGHGDYERTGGSATYKGQDLFEMEPEERARAGLFMSFQSPVEVGCPKSGSLPPLRPRSHQL